MKQIDPFAEIQKRPLYTDDRFQSSGYTVRVRNGIDEITLDPSWTEAGVVKREYLLIPNREVVNMANDIASQTGLEWNEERCLFNGKHFLYTMTTNDEDGVTADVKTGDTLGLGMLWENSYDGTRALGFSLFVNRLVCENGMIAPLYFNKFRFKHDRTSEKWEDEVARASKVLEFAPQNLQSFANSAQNLLPRIGTSELSKIRTDALSSLGPQHWGSIMDRYLKDGDYTGWGLLNACTHNFWHKKNITVRDFKNNEYCVSGLLNHANA